MSVIDDARARAARYAEQAAARLVRCPNQPDGVNTHAPATERVGARDYCPRCAARMDWFLYSAEQTTTRRGE